jgi:hypothetical protein
MLFCFRGFGNPKQWMSLHFKKETRLKFLRFQFLGTMSGIMRLFFGKRTFKLRIQSQQ